MFHDISMVHLFVWYKLNKIHESATNRTPQPNLHELLTQQIQTLDKQNNKHLMHYTPTQVYRNTSTITVDKIIQDKNI